MGRLKVIASLALMLMLLGTMGFFLTKDSLVTDQTTEETMLELKTNKKALENTLEKNTSKQIEALFKQYYTQKTQEEEFAEGYEDTVIYTFPAQRLDDYIIYVTYQMKIKDLDTRLPGMGTFYVKRMESGIYQIVDIASDVKFQEDVKKASENEEVQALIQTIENDFRETKEKNPELNTALEELQKAYQ